ncbi:MAG: DUF2007 domain-containing protein [Gammaproteobacteria bacterium]|nr:DUF2007 domain-containing protein [Gammaproteobacteria bacterium]
MKKLYTHENRIIIFNLRNVLEDKGIETIIMNEFASGGAGDLATFDTWPELWIDDDQQFEQAEAIVKNILQNREDEYWFCRGCREKNDSSFEYCWNCGQSSEESY